METKHTPGPWVSTEEGKIAQIGGGFVPVRTPFRADAFTDGPHRSDHPESELLANARLIAAAPELLGTLQAMVNVFSAEKKRDPRICSAAVQQARAAINKATQP